MSLVLLGSPILIPESFTGLNGKKKRVPPTLGKQKKDGEVG